MVRMTTPPVTPRWKRTRSDLLDESLQRFTLVWMKSLPEAVRPMQCARHYPRVLNKIAALWGLPDRCLDQLAELQTDRRGNRQGFGHGVLQELQHLQAYRITLLPTPAAQEEPDFPPTVPMGLD